MKRFSFYHAETGVFSSKRYYGNYAALASNTPHSHVPLEGVYDRRTQRMDIVAGEVVAYEPPPPSADEVRAKARREALQAIQRLEASQQRAIREAVLSGDSARLQDIEQKIAEIRKEIQ
jgi:hypothetical protein